MYKNIIVHQLSAEKRYQEILAQGLGQKEWVLCYLPIKEQLHGHRKRFPMLRSSRILFSFDGTYNRQWELILNLPLIGFIYPIFTDALIENFDRHLYVYTALYEHMKNRSCTFLILGISGSENLKNSVYGDFEWWQNIFQRPDRRPLDWSRIEVAECSIHHLDRLPHIIADKFELRPDSIVDENPSSRLPHPHIPNTSFNLQNLGCGKGASVGFVEDCLEGILSNGTRVRVWVDLAKRIKWVHQHFTVNVDLGPQYVDCDERNVLDNLLHAYMEVEGCAFDSMMAFQEPISIGEFQKRLNSSWRVSIDITPEMSVDEAKSAVQEAVEQARKRVLD